MKHRTPPQWPIRILSRLSPEDHHDILQGDLLELYKEHRSRFPKWLADILYVANTLDLTWRFLSFRRKLNNTNYPSMLKNYAKVSIRHLIKNKSASFISIVSLVISLTFSLVIFNYVAIEKEFDAFIPNKENKYRVVFDIYGTDGRNVHDAGTPAPYAPFFTSKIPAIERYTRFMERRNVMVSNPGKQIAKLPFVGWADANLLDFMGIKLINGNGHIEDPNSILLDESTANLLFESPTEALGGTIRYNDVLTLTVQGVYKDFPQASTVKFNAIGNIDVLQELLGWYYQEGQNWGGYSFHTYFEVNPNSDLDKIKEAFQTQYFERTEIDPNELPEEYYQFGLINVGDIHLHSDMSGEMTPPTSYMKLKMLTYLAIVIAIIGWINFINIQSARVPERLKEIGIRISLGANAAGLRLMFLVEYLIICIFSSFIAFILLFYSTKGLLHDLLKISLPELSLGYTALSILFSGTFLACFYPAVVASRQIQEGVVKTLKKNKAIELRNLMISLQFVISLFLVVLTITINRQVHFMNALDPGFDAGATLVIPGPITQSEDDMGKARQFTNELVSLASVDQATFTTLAPGKSRGWEGNLPSRDGENSKTQKVNLANVFSEFFEVMEIKAVAGRIPKGPQQTENLPRVILNETAVEGFNWTAEEAIGKKVGYADDAVVIAVVEDFKTVGFQEKLLPMVFIYDHIYFRNTTNDYFIAKVNSGDIITSIATLRERYVEIFPDNDFSYDFSNELFAAQYEKERDFNKLIVTFSILSILLSLIGLAGITAYHVILKRKEIGIRKVLGSGVPQILMLFVRRYLYLILVAGLIGLPLAYFYANNWLSNFDHRIEIGLWVLIIPLGVLTMLVVTIVSLASLKAAQVNPVNVLKEE